MKYISLFLVLLLVACSTEKKVDSKKEYNRLVSLIPSATETVFLLGAEDKLVGVSTYSNYPEKAKTLPKVGSLFDTDYEKILKLSPDLVLILSTSDNQKQGLSKLGIEYMEVNFNTLSEIDSAIIKIGNKLSKQQRAQFVIDSLNTIKRQIFTQTNTKPLKVLISVGRDFNTPVKEIYSCGEGTYFNEILTNLGYQNVISSSLVYPHLTAETVLRENPDVIIDLVAEMNELNITEKDLKSHWSHLSDVNAVKNGNIFVIGGRFVTIPSSRLYKLAEIMKDSISTCE